jgi:hypothetical protein
VVRGTQFACFTSTKVQILTPAELRASKKCKFGPIDHGHCADLTAHHGEHKGGGTHFTCFTGTKRTQILTLRTAARFGYQQRVPQV